MRKLLIILCVLSITVGCKKEPLEDWKLVWEDEFNRDDIFSTGIWSKIWGCPTSDADWCKTMSQDPSLFEIKNGNLILLGKPSSDPVKDKSKYITGGVSTKNKKYFQNGRLEIRCKLEAHQGAWPAIWMVPDAPWPTGGEIDIVERLNYDPFVYHTLHSPYTPSRQKRPF